MGKLLMSHESLVTKFIESFGAIGVYLQKGGTVIPLSQAEGSSRGLVVVRRHLSELTRETNEVEEEGEQLAALCSDLTDEARLILVAERDRLEEVAKHWKRFFPTIAKQIDVEAIIASESKEGKILRLCEAIEMRYSAILEEQGGHGRE